MEPKPIKREGILYSAMGRHKVEAYNDANWVGSIIDQQSTIGYYDARISDFAHRTRTDTIRYKYGYRIPA